MANPAFTTDRPLRSIFVGNIPYEATEEKLKEVFSEVGPILSFKLMYDRETGKPKGYGFCEYKDPETALSALRNLTNVEIHGRILRVDSALSEKGSFNQYAASSNISNMNTNANAFYNQQPNPNVNYSDINAQTARSTFNNFASFDPSKNNPINPLNTSAPYTGSSPFIYDGTNQNLNNNTIMNNAMNFGNVPYGANIAPMSLASMPNINQNTSIPLNYQQVGGLSQPSTFNNRDMSGTTNNPIQKPPQDALQNGENNVNVEPSQTANNEQSSLNTNGAEAIVKAVASLPAEQMFELMKQMKVCVRNNYNEARNMLLQNPQLAYALLQVQVMMGLVDGNTALTFLTKNRAEAQAPKTLNLNSNLPTMVTQIAPSMQPMQESLVTNSPSQNIPLQAPQFQSQQPPFAYQSSPYGGETSPSPVLPPPAPPKLEPPAFLIHQQQQNQIQQNSQQSTFVVSSIPTPGANTSKTVKGDIFPDFGASGDIDMRALSAKSMNAGQRDGNKLALSTNSPNTYNTEAKRTRLEENRSSSSTPATPQSLIKNDTEKNQLIQQVMKLTDSQIAQLPPDQQKNIQLIKQQLLKSGLNLGSLAN